MATKKETPLKKTVKRTTKKINRSAPAATDSLTAPIISTTSKKSNQRFVLNTLLVILVGVIIFLLAKRYKNLVIAGVVNKSPITIIELNQAMSKRYGTAVLDEIVNERLLLQAASENQVSVDNQEIQAEVKKLEESLGGNENLLNAMKQYNINEEDLQKQVKLRLIQQKLTDKLVSVEVTDEEVTEYYNTNKAVFEGKKLDEVKEDIKTDLSDQKRQQKFNEWFQEYKTKAQIVYYL